MRGLFACFHHRTLLLAPSPCTFLTGCALGPCGLLPRPAVLCFSVQARGCPLSCSHGWPSGWLRGCLPPPGVAAAAPVQRLGLAGDVFWEPRAGPGRRAGLCSRWHSWFPYELLPWVLPSSVLGRVSGDKEGGRSARRSSGFAPRSPRRNRVRLLGGENMRQLHPWRPQVQPKPPGTCRETSARPRQSPRPSLLGNESPDPELPFVPVPTAGSQTVPSVSSRPAPCPPRQEAGRGAELHEFPGPFGSQATPACLGLPAGCRIFAFLTNLFFSPRPCIVTFGRGSKTTLVDGS